jgi:glutamate dehydrogenase
MSNTPVASPPGAQAPSPHVVSDRLRVPGIYTAAKPSSDSSLNVVKNVPGYKTPVFSGKAEQRARVQEKVTAKGFLPNELVKFEVDWFYDSLGIEENYFANEAEEVITDHIIALFAAKTLAYTKHSDQLVIELEKITENGALFIHTSAPAW